MNTLDQLLQSHAAMLDARVEATRLRHQAIIQECADQLQRELREFNSRHAHRVAIMEERNA